MNEFIEELHERGITVKQTEVGHTELDIAEYADQAFGEIISDLSMAFIRKYDFTPDILFLGWATYLAILTHQAQQEGIKEPEINQTKLFGMHVLVMDVEHGMTLGFSDNGMSAQMYYKESEVRKLAEGSQED